MANSNQIALEIALTESGVEPTRAKLTAALLAIQRALGITANTGNQSADELIRASNRVTEATQDQAEATQEAGQASVTAGNALGSISDALNNVGQSLGPLGDQFTQAASGLGEIAATAGPVAALTAGLAALSAASVVVIGKLFDISSATADVAKQSEEFQRFVGIGRELAAGLELGAKAVGASIGDLKDGLAQFKGVLNEAFQGAEDKQEALAALGATDFTSLETALGQIATKLQSSGDAARGLSVELNKAFGEEGSRQLEPILKGLAESKRRAEEFGLVIKEDIVKQSLEFKSVFGDIEAQIQGATNVAGGRFLKAFTEAGKVVSDVISQLRNNAAFTAGLENLANLTEKIITGPLPTLVNLLGDVVAFSGKFAGFLAVAAGGFDTLEAAIAKLPTTVDATIEKIRALDKTTVNYSDAIKRVIAELEKLQKIREANNQGLDASVAQQIALIDAAEKAGSKSALVAAEEKNRIRLDQAEREKNQAQSDLEFLRNRLDEEVKAQGKAKESTVQQEQIALDKRKQQQGLYDEVVKGLEVKRNQFLFDLNQQSSKLTQEQFEKNKALAQKNFEQDLANNSRLSIIKQGILKLDNEITTAQAKRANAENNISQLQQKFGEKDLELRAKREETEANLLQARQENAARTEAAILTTKQNSIASANKLESEAIAEQKQLLQSKARNAQEVEDQITKINIVAQQDRLTAAEAALNTFTEKNIQNAELRKQLETDIANEQIKLSDLKTKQTIDNINREISVLKSTIEVTQDINLKAIEKIELEQKTLELLKAQGATKEQLLAQENKITSALQEAVKISEQRRAVDKKALDERLAAISKVLAGEDAINARIAASADRSNSAVDKLKGGLSVVGETADIAGQSVEQLQDRIQQLEGSIDFIRNVAAIPDKDVFINENLRVIEELNARIIQLTQGAALEKAAEEARIAEEKARETQSKLDEIRQDGIDRTFEANEQLEEDIADLQQDKLDEQSKFNDTLIDLENDFNADILSIKEKQAEEAKEIADRAIADEEERQRRILEIKKKATKEASDFAGQLELNALGKLGGLEEKIKKATDPKEKLKLEEELAEEKDKIDRANRKKEAIAALEGQNLSEAEFIAKKEAIEAQFRLEEDAAQQRIEINKITDETIKAQKLARLDQLIKEQEARNKKASDDELKNIKEAEARKQKAFDDEQAQRKANYEKQEKDREDAYNQQVSKEIEEHQQRVEDLKGRGEEIRNTYEETLGDIQEDQKQAAEELAKSVGLAGTAFEDAFDRANDKGKKLLDTLGQINNELGQSQNAGNSNSSSGSNSNNTGIGNNTGNQNGGGNSSNSNSGNGNSNNSNSGNQSNSSNNNSNSNSNSNNSSNSNSNNSSSGQSKNEAKKERAEAIDNLPKTAKTSSEYKSNANKIFDAHAAFIKDRKRNYSIFVKHFDAFRFLTVDYFKQNEVFVDPKTANSFGLPFGILDPAAKPLEFADQKEAKGGFNKVVDSVIAFVENSKKDTSKGTDKAGDISAEGGSIITPGLSSDSSSGGSKGDVADQGNQSGSVAPPPEAPEAPKDTRFDPKRENEGEGFNEFTDKIIPPDSGIPKAPSSPTTPNSPGSATPTINNQPTIAPTIAPTINLTIQQSGNGDINEQMRRLNTALNDVSNQAAQQLINNLTTQLTNKLEQIFR